MIYDKRIGYLDMKILSLDIAISVAGCRKDKLKRARDKAVEEQIRLLQYQLNVLHPQENTI